MLQLTSTVTPTATATSAPTSPVSMSLTNYGLDDLPSFDPPPDMASGVTNSNINAKLTPNTTDGVAAAANTTTTPSAPGSPTLTYAYEDYDDAVELNFPSSPSRSLISSDAGSSSFGRNQSHSNKAVHMHVQENAKVPLLNQAVDRRNSSRPWNRTGGVSVSPTETTAAYSGSSMAELFLRKESKHRHSLNMNYEHLGSLLDELGNPIGSTPSKTTRTKEEEAQMEIDALTAAIDPTPWSEIERKMHHDEVAPVPAPAPSTAPHPHHYNYYPYGRQHQLPIPEMRIASPTKPSAPEGTAAATMTNPSSATIAQAVATAAALASVAPTAAAPAVAPSPPPSSLAPQSILATGPQQSVTAAPIVAAPYTKAQQTTVYAGPAAPPMGQYPRAGYAPPQHATAHSTSRASVLAAASKKSQYGFGGNHMVPSVPAPPPIAANMPRAKLKPPKTISKPIPRLPPTSTTSHLPPSHDQHHYHHHLDPGANNSGAAYERKKQRAKDARVKLNDAIERLSIAMGLAGSQSRQRIGLLNGRVRTTEQRPKTLQINEECSNLAEQAKKWDRPSFVGTAAALVQALNSQCESLSRELICLQEKLDAATGTTQGVPGSVPVLPLPGDHLHAGVKREEHPSKADAGSPHKRLKGLEEVGNSHEPMNRIEISQDQQLAFGKVAELLDPVSLSRCPCVSKAWRDMKVFDREDTWLQLGVQRFGFYNVRQWAEKLEEGISKKSLYRAMSAANVAPHFPQEGLSLLGKAKIPGRLSCWVYLVERSNGETLRSVKREPGSDQGGLYQSRPVVELRVVLQNTGMASHPVLIKNQQISVDVSTRRTGGELGEVFWDDRFSKVVKHLDGSKYAKTTTTGSRYDLEGELCRLHLFESAMINTHLNAKGCPTTSKFQQRSNFLKVLVSLEGTTVPMVVPFLRDGSHGGSL